MTAHNPPIWDCLRRAMNHSNGLHDKWTWGLNVEMDRIMTLLKQDLQDVEVAYGRPLMDSFDPNIPLSGSPNSGRPPAQGPAPQPRQRLVVPSPAPDPYLKGVDERRLDEPPQPQVRRRLKV